jgi:hypothetical protein
MLVCLSQEGVDHVATAAARALIVDCVPTPQQNTANAWAGRMIGIGNVVGYLKFLPLLSVDGSGYINLPKYFPSLGRTQFQILCILAPVSLVSTMTVTCVVIKEADPALLFSLPEDPDAEKKSGVQAALHVFSFFFLVEMLTLDFDEYFSSSRSRPSNL